MNSVVPVIVKEYLDMRYTIFQNLTGNTNLHEIYNTVRDAIESIVVIDYEYTVYIRFNIENGIN